MTEWCVQPVIEKKKTQNVSLLLMYEVLEVSPELLKKKE